MASLQAPESVRQYGGDFAENDAIRLQQAVEKIVRLGKQVGVTPEEMISLLDSGVSISDLLVFLALSPPRAN